MPSKTDTPVDQAAVAGFIAKWQNTPGGAERANYQLFLTEFAQALTLPTAQPAAGGTLGEYQFDAPIPGGALASGGTGFADLYRKGSFLLEAKQSQIPKDKRDQPELFDPGAAVPAAASGAKYDKLMRGALAQARNYVTHLPADHPWPPFIIVCDVGRAFELYFDWAGNGRGYDFFPDRLSYRVTLDRLAESEVQALFRDIWLAPKARDPRLKAAEVTRTVARRLAEVSKWLEETQRLKGHQTDRAASEAVERTSLFLMRLLFCMFAEDIGLLEKGRFTAFLKEGVEDERHFENGLRELWRLMGTAGGDTRYSFVLKTDVRYFNGGLFADQQVFPLSVEARGELLVAAKQDWKNVEPAIFGTLLEQALTTTERAKLGAHYTPRPYVERLVRATIMDVLEAEWAAVQGRVEDAVGRDSLGDAIAALTAFHARLTTVRVLDPACGTGNFLYVAMELLLRLEADVLDTLEKVGGHAEPGVGPRQFHGLELNPRAAVIAELVLWIGWLRWRMANDPDSVAEPVLSRTETINYGGRGVHHAGFDAVLRRTATGEPDTDNPVPPAWPEAEFIVGNPPFIGGKDIRSTLGGDVAEALWAANPRVPKSADFVMQWWDRAAHLLAAKDSPLRRFGFVTTNSITQEFSRRVMARYLDAPAGERLSLTFAVPDHPWTKAGRDAAAVRIAMTVAERGERAGAFVEVTGEAALDTDTPELTLAETEATIHADLSIGADATAAKALLANEGLASPGVKLHGSGFIVTPAEAKHLGLGTREGLDAHVRPYCNGRDLMGSSRGVMAIDLLGLDEKEVRQRFPEVYQHLLKTVEPARAKQVKKSPTKDAQEYHRRWWLHGKPREQLRPALAGLPRYIATVETAKHRVFQFLDAAILPDNMLVAIASEEAWHLGVLSSSAHLQWTFANCGLLGVASFVQGHRYTKSRCFDPFAFPDATADQRTALAELAEELDATRKLALAEVPRLTMTELYNLRDRLRSGDPLKNVEEDRATAARAAIVNRLHDQIDAAVAAAYGWPADLPPSEIVARLVALNAERAAEEAAGKVRWLRPDYQRPRFG